MDSQHKNEKAEPSGAITSSRDARNPTELTRQELLSAIDFEISQRQESITRYGLTVWGAVGTIVALLWTAIDRATSEPHDWPRLLLVFFVGWLLLDSITALLFRTINHSSFIIHGQSRRTTIRHEVFLRGIDPDTLPFYAMESILRIAAAAYLYWAGYHVLGLASFILFLCVLLFCSFIWVFCRINLPLGEFNPRHPDPKRLSNQIVSVIVWGTWFIVLVVGVMELVVLSPRASVSDIRLGLLLAAAVTIFMLLVRVTRPAPFLPALRQLRSRIAFAMVDNTTARTEALDIFLGPSERSYVTNKAEAVLMAIGERTRLANEVTAKMNRIIALSTQLAASPADVEIQKAAAAELRDSYKILKASIDAADASLKIAQKLRGELRVRVRAAKMFTRVAPSELDAVGKRVDEAGVASNAAMEQARALLDPFTTARKSLEKVLKESNLPSSIDPLTKTDIFTALFRD